MSTRATKDEDLPQYVQEELRRLRAQAAEHTTSAPVPQSTMVVSTVTQMRTDRMTNTTLDVQNAPVSDSCPVMAISQDQGMIVVPLKDIEEFCKVLLNKFHESVGGPVWKKHEIALQRLQEAQAVAEKAVAEKAEAEAAEVRRSQEPDPT